MWLDRYAAALGRLGRKVRYVVAEGWLNRDLQCIVTEIRGLRVQACLGKVLHETWRRRKSDTDQRGGDWL